MRLPDPTRVVPDMDLSCFPRRRYTKGSTPIEPLPRLSAALAASCPGGRGPEVWIKRDDLLGFSPGGNKTRKCRRRSKSEPPCRPNIEPGVEADFELVGCG
jgi:hypothetical protein